MKLHDLMAFVRQEGVLHCSEYLQLAGPDSLIFFGGGGDYEHFSNGTAPKLLVSTGPTPTAARQLILRPEEFFLAKRLVAQELYPRAFGRNLIGVTGTNGKTSVVSMAEKLLERACSIGTLGVSLQGCLQEKTLNTTPAYCDLCRILHHYEAETYLLEVTSHALKQKRLQGLSLSQAYWTNFSRDHLDYHGDMDDYFQSKLAIVGLLRPKGRLWVLAKEEGLRKKLGDRPVVGLVEDAPQAPFGGVMRKNLSLALHLAGPRKELPDNLLPEGRFQMIQKHDLRAIIDYAHTPQALENLLMEAKAQFPGHEVILVFGCGGGRDRGKRKIMGEVAKRQAHRVIVTSDNPRWEDPAHIARDILQGLGDCEVILDRRVAVARGVALAQGPGKVLIVAGKGHEDGQEICGRIFPFKDEECL